jgi:excisionase family DNA binding protein
MPDTVSQLALFEAFDPQTERAPKLGLPFQKTQEIDVERARKILGISKQTMRRMLENHLIRAYRAKDKRGTWRIEYSSVVEYCDKLRVQHCISANRVSLAGTRRRHRDRELLPFPLDETVYVTEVQERLECGATAVTHLIESGSLVGYQVLFETTGCPWRIHAPSVEQYLRSLHAMAGKGPSSRAASPLK